MNIFVVDANPVVAGMSLCNKHVVKMPLETAQLLCTAVNALTGLSAPYKPCHINHPCSVWTRQSQENFDWLVEHGLALCDAYFVEYGKVHKSRDIIVWAENNKPDISMFPKQGLAEHPKCMPDEFKTGDLVKSYRNYYIGAKAKIAKWNKRRKPEWFIVPLTP